MSKSSEEQVVKIPAGIKRIIFEFDAAEEPEKEVEETEEGEDEDEDEDDDGSKNAKEEKEEEEEDGGEEDGDEDDEDGDEDDEDEDEDDEDEDDEEKGEKKEDEEEDDDEGEDDGDDKPESREEVAQEYVEGQVSKGEIDEKGMKEHLESYLLKFIDHVDAKIWPQYKEIAKLADKKVRKAYEMYALQLVDDDKNIAEFNTPYIVTAKGQKAPTPFCNGVPMVRSKDETASKLLQEGEVLAQDALSKCFYGVTHDSTATPPIEFREIKVKGKKDKKSKGKK